MLPVREWQLPALPGCCPLPHSRRRCCPRHQLSPVPSVLPARAQLTQPPGCMTVPPAPPSRHPAPFTWAPSSVGAWLCVWLPKECGGHPALGIRDRVPNSRDMGPCTQLPGVHGCSQGSTHEPPAPVQRGGCLQCPVPCCCPGCRAPRWHYRAPGPRAEHSASISSDLLFFFLGEENRKYIIFSFFFFLTIFLYILVFPCCRRREPVGCLASAHPLPRSAPVGGGRKSRCPSGLRPAQLVSAVAGAAVPAGGARRGRAVPYRGRAEPGRAEPCRASPPREGGGGAGGAAL